MLAPYLPKREHVENADRDIGLKTGTKKYSKVFHFLTKFDILF
jgi:hypothetical protein